MKIISISRILLIFSLILIIMGCEKSDEQISELSGSWIEFTNRNDTIDFDFWNSETDVFILKRGFVLQNGYWLPKYGSVPYQYIIKTDIPLYRKGA